MAKKIKIVSPYLLILALAGLMIGFNIWTSLDMSIWHRYVEADDLGTSVSVGNVAPAISNVCLDGYPRGVETITVTEDSDIEIVASATVTDSTCDDITAGGVKAYVFRSGVQWQPGEETTCSFNYNNCYTPEFAGGNLDCIQQSCSNGVAVYDCTASASADGGDGMWYHVDATNAGASYSTQEWFALVLASDSSGAWGWASNSIDIDVAEQSAITLAAASDSLAYGPVAPGAESADTLARGVENTGNSEINITIQAGAGDGHEETAALENATFGNIATAQQQYGTADFEIGDGTSLSETATELDVTLPQPTTHVQGSNDDQIFWGIAIPAATSPGLYSGKTTYSVAKE